MLYPVRVASQLAVSVERFRAFADDERLAFRQFERATARLNELPVDELSAILAAAERPGALPCEEWPDHGGLFVPFGRTFPHHRAAREWALERIHGVRTIAVDGSEIKPTKDYSLPVAAVQVAWFDNPHDAAGRYVKDVEFQIVHPEELAAEHGDGFGVVDQLIALRRFQAEVDRLIERMHRSTHTSGHGPPVAFFDGSLVVSFAVVMLESIGAAYIASICRLIEASERCQVPVVGYVDTSLAKDLATMLAVFGNINQASRIPDSRLIDGRLNWGDRTRALVCARADVLGRYQTPDGRDLSNEICFTYLKTNRQAPPARLDVPRWVVRAGLLDHVVDVVRAEAIVGNGYPYCVEAADACAVLGTHDREHFYRLVQDFARGHAIELRLVPKAASKRRRRAL
jgi:hypothetical protein